MKLSKKRRRSRNVLGATRSRAGWSNQIAKRRSKRYMIRFKDSRKKRCAKSIKPTRRHRSITSGRKVIVRPVRIPTIPACPDRIDHNALPRHQESIAGGLPEMQGPAGQQGAQGMIGPQGAAGRQGMPGVQGPVGAQGERGEAGSSGAQGPMGHQGFPGEQGVAGVQGPAGPQGERGEAGSPGAQGPMGPQGVPGEQGAVGAQGPAGPQGEPGPTGPQGEQGPPGTVAGVQVVPATRRYFYFPEDNLDLTSSVTIPAEDFVDDEEGNVTEFAGISTTSYYNLYINGILQPGGSYILTATSLFLPPQSGVLLAGTPIIVEIVQLTAIIINS